jgi:hypothetical protein
VTRLRTILILALLATAGCPRRDGEAPGAPVGTAAPAPQPPASAVASNPPWTEERVRQFVVETDQQLLEARGEADAKNRDARAIGQCYGDDAFPMGKASHFLPLLEGRLTGRALNCYLATYFGCRLGDMIASAGFSRLVPPVIPFFEARAAIIEQSPDRVVAEVGEAEYNMVLKGKLVPAQADGKSEYKFKSRYTLTRDAQGVWRIADRVPSFSEWECREK